MSDTASDITGRGHHFFWIILCSIWKKSFCLDPTISVPLGGGTVVVYYLPLLPYYPPSTFLCIYPCSILNTVLHPIFTKYCIRMFFLTTHNLTPWFFSWWNLCWWGSLRHKQKLSCTYVCWVSILHWDSKLGLGPDPSLILCLSCEPPPLMGPPCGFCHCPMQLNTHKLFNIYFTYLCGGSPVSKV